MAREARQLGLGVMVGNMVGTSLAMAPAFVLGQLCDIVDLDGPIFLARIASRASPTTTASSGAATTSGDRRRTRGACIDARTSNWFGQPRGLTILFLTEMWENFSYYGMRSLLVYYMTKQLLIGQEKSSLIYGTYTAMAYFTPIIGGVISDRWLGKRRAVIIGGAIMAAGHFMMAFEPLFYVALATIALGNGLFLPSLPSQINDLYKPDDPRRGWAYNVYYVGINIGGFLAPLDLRHARRILWLALGLRRGRHRHAGGTGHLYRRRQVSAGAGSEVERKELRDAPIKRGRETLLLLLGVGLAVTIFRGAYEQVGNTVALFADAGIDRTTSLADDSDDLVPVAQSAARDPDDAARCSRTGSAAPTRAANPSSMQKMATGAMIVAVAYLMLAFAAWFAGDGRASWIWLVAFFVVFTLGELYILPTGLGLFARLAPPSLGATTVAAWFLAIFTGSFAAGWSARCGAR